MEGGYDELDGAAAGYEQTDHGDRHSRSAQYAAISGQVPAIHQQQYVQHSGAAVAAFRSRLNPSSNTSAYGQLYGQNVLQFTENYMQDSTFRAMQAPFTGQVKPLADSAYANEWPSPSTVPTMPTYGQLEHTAGFRQQLSDRDRPTHQSAEGDGVTRRLSSQFDNLAWPEADNAATPELGLDRSGSFYGAAPLHGTAVHSLAKSFPASPQSFSLSHPTPAIESSVAQQDSHSKRQRQQHLSQAGIPPPRKKVKRNPDPERTARKPAPPRKQKQVRDIGSLISHLEAADTIALIGRRAGDMPSDVPIFMQDFSSKQYALDHLLRVGSSISFFPSPPELAINLEELESSTRPTLQQLLLEAVAQPPSADTTPGYLRDEADRHSFTEKISYQYATVVKQIVDAQDSSACICLLVQCLIDLHDKDKGIPINDLDLRGQEIEAAMAKDYTVKKLSTKKGSYPIDFSLSFFQRATLLMDIVRKYKWVAKDVLTNTNILEMVVSPRQYLSAKLNNVSTAKTRQDRWNEDQVRRGVKVSDQIEGSGVEVAREVRSSVQEEQPATRSRDQALPHLFGRYEEANSTNEYLAGSTFEDLSRSVTHALDAVQNGDGESSALNQEPAAGESWCLDNTRRPDQYFGWN